MYGLEKGARAHIIVASFSEWETQFILIGMRM